MNKIDKHSGQSQDVVIIGAGASGLFCALTLGDLLKQQQKTACITVLDHASKAGKKILMSGGGRCNFENLELDFCHFVGENPQFVRSALAKFTPEQFLAYVYKHGIDFHEKLHGQLFCNNSSKDIVTMLLDECQKAGVEIRLDSTITSIDKTDNGFDIAVAPKAGTAYTLFCSSLVVATGGLSIPTLGATGFGYDIAKQFGHTIIPTAPSLVPFTFTDGIKTLATSLAGVSHDVVAFNPKQSFALPLLFTHRGLSGPAILQLSNYWKLGEPIWINLLPNVVAKEYLLQQKTLSPKKHIKSVLADFFAKNLLAALEEVLWSELKQQPLADIKDEKLIALGDTLNGWQLKPSGTEGYRVAEVTIGGVSTDAISSKTFESAYCPNLYFVGEVLDVTGWLGGYNFHWAWASGYACACAICHKMMSAS